MEERRSSTGGGSWCLEGVYKPRQTPTSLLPDTRDPLSTPLKSQPLAVIGRFSPTPDKPRHRAPGRGPYGKKPECFLRSVRSVVRVYPGPFSEVIAPLGLTGLGGVFLSAIPRYSRTSFPQLGHCGAFPNGFTAFDLDSLSFPVGGLVTGQDSPRKPPSTKVSQVFQRCFLQLSRKSPAEGMPSHSLFLWQVRQPLCLALVSSPKTSPARLT